MEKNLCFGLMRLPQKGDAVDLQAVCALADRFLEKGFCWFDTAKPYHGGNSEEIFRLAVSERHKRETFKLADKLSQNMLQEGETPRQFFEKQLERTGLDCFDRYLLHAMDAPKIAEADEKGYWEFLISLKKEGLAKSIGFSFHDTAEVLDKALAAHPEMDFVQLQINYADWESSGVQSRLCYETAEKYGKKVLVMEPVKGGMLAGLPEEAAKVLKALHPDWSIASWAIRFAAGLPQVETVLSGMSDQSQLLDNMAVMTDFSPLGERELSALEEVRTILEKIPQVPCTRCGYCLEHCPAELPIPNLLGVLNSSRLFGAEPARGSFNWYARKHKPSECLRCHACEKVCPQHLHIPEYMTELKESFE
ncbi:MAG: aldo/keto reductase [Lentisphaeria bacterium]|nr:aldo/keto reductase [Lentisphaeria bacterium]